MIRLLLRLWWEIRKEYYLLKLHAAAPNQPEVGERIHYCEWHIRRYRA